jgi:hypothetical protein
MIDFDFKAAQEAELPVRFYRKDWVLINQYYLEL